MPGRGWVDGRGRGRGVVSQVESAAGAGAGALGGGGVGQQGGLEPAGDGVRAAQPRAGGHPAPARRLGRRVDGGRAGGGCDRAGFRATTPATGPRPRDVSTGCDRARADQARCGFVRTVRRGRGPTCARRNPNPVTEAGLGSIHGGAGHPRGAARGAPGRAGHAPHDGGWGRPGGGVPSSGPTRDRPRRRDPADRGTTRDDGGRGSRAGTAVGGAAHGGADRLPGAGLRVRCQRGGDARRQPAGGHGVVAAALAVHGDRVAAGQARPRPHPWRG